VFVLSFIQSGKIEDQPKASKLVFICDRRDKSQFLGAMLILLKAAKATLDPQGLLNPGVLIDS
jgi:hypothetical protein